MIDEDILAAARAASCKMRDRKRNKANDAVLQAAIAEVVADFEATIAGILDRQRALEERQQILEQQTAATLSALLMRQTI